MSKFPLVLLSSAAVKGNGLELSCAVQDHSFVLLQHPI